MRSGSITPLLSDEILERMGGACEFTDVFFKHWLQREFVRLITKLRNLSRARALWLAPQVQNS